MKFVTFVHLMSVLFVLWGNSRYAPVGRNSGFYCNDTTIMEPYNGDSINLTMLLISLLGGTAFVIYMSERLLKDQTCEGRNSFKWYAQHYYSGLLYVITITEILKLGCGQLRPHFLTTCQPDMEQIQCSDGFITNFKCTGEGPDWLVKRDIYKSFPSGHASLSFYTFIFLSIYIYSCSKNPSQMSLRCWKMFVFVLPLVWSIVCCISRLMDRRHFWWDILCGVLIGLVGGLIMGKWCVYKTAQQKMKHK